MTGLGGGEGGGGGFFIKEGGGGGRLIIKERGGERDKGEILDTNRFLGPSDGRGGEIFKCLRETKYDLLYFDRHS